MSVEPLPLRWKATLTGALVAIAAGSLLVAMCSHALPKGGDNTGLAIAGNIVLWAFTAVCIYAANQQWIGRARTERVERFALCLLVAVPILVAALVLGVTLYVNTGGPL